MSTDKPTPLPWDHDLIVSQDGEECHCVLFRSGVAYMEIATGLLIADAALIVRAVNREPAFDALLAAAKALRAMAGVPCTSQYAKTVLVNLDAAIEAVEKEQDNGR